MSDDAGSSPTGLAGRAREALAALRARARDDGHRERGWDLARSFAIVMMVLINFQLMLAERPPSSGLDHGEQVLRWLVHVPSGRSSSLFVVLSGVGFSLLTRRARLEGGLAARVARRTVLLRAAFLFVLGNLLHVVWSIDILHFYACYLAIAALLFLRARDATLAAIGALVTIAAAVIDVALPGRAELPYLSPLGMLLDVVIDGVHPILPWLAFVAYGAWLGRRDLSDRPLRRAFLRRALLVVVCTELASLAIAHLVLRAPSLAPLVPALGITTTSWDPAPLFVVSACGTATAFVCVAHEIVLHPRLASSRVVRALVSSGQLALSLYLTHAIVGVVLPRFFLGVGHAMSVGAVTLYWLAFVLAAIVGSALYRSVLPRGPLEALMRALTSWQRASERAALAGPPSAHPMSGPTSGPTSGPSSPREGVVRGVWAFVGLGALVLVAARIVGLDPVGHDDAPIVIGGARTIAGELTLVSPRRRYALRVERPSEVTIETRSGLDLYLELDRVEASPRRIAEDDDGGEGLDARLTASLSPGDYTLLVRPYGATTGPFAVRLDAQP